FPKECFPLPVKKFRGKRFQKKLNLCRQILKPCLLKTTLLTQLPFLSEFVILKILKKDFLKFSAYSKKMEFLWFWKPLYLRNSPLNKDIIFIQKAFFRLWVKYFQKIKWLTNI